MDEKYQNAVNHFRNKAHYFSNIDFNLIAKEFTDAANLIEELCNLFNEKKGATEDEGSSQN